jgi:hypothetical protein
MFTWHDLTFPPINLWNVPRQPAIPSATPRREANPVSHRPRVQPITREIQRLIQSR